MEAARDQIMRGVGTLEPWFRDIPDFPGHEALSVQYRRPLRIEEVAQMAPTSAVRERKGRG